MTIRTIFFFGLCMGALLAVAGCGRQKPAVSLDTFTAVRRPLEIKISDSGSLDAARSQDIQSQVSRAVRLLELIPEGTIITEDDVLEGKVLVRLDASLLEEDLVTRKNEFDSAKASYQQALESAFIQTSTNESDIRKAEMDVVFARNDFRKLVGDKIADRYAEKPPPSINDLLKDPDLGGATEDLVRTYQSDIDMAAEELTRAKIQLEGTLKLFEKGYVSADTKAADELNRRRKDLSLTSSKAKLEIFQMYEFQKNFQEAWAKCRECQDKLERTKAVARSKMAQEEASQNSARAKFQASSQRLEAMIRDIDNCVILATEPGIVTYPAANMHGRNVTVVEVGDDIRPETIMLRLPDLSKMVISVDIHESQADLVQVGQDVDIQVDAVPNRHFQGKVFSKAIMPSSQNAWLNPDLKVYPTKIAIDTDENTLLRPGMSASVTIKIETIPDVLQMPLQAVVTGKSGRHYCFMSSGEAVEIQVGKHNQNFIEIKSGIKAGDQILLAPPVAIVDDGEPPSAAAPRENGKPGNGKPARTMPREAAKPVPGRADAAGTKPGATRG
jgi:multidrug efflux pump subunit AcrA (membrane-fusion protein)